MAHDAAVAQRGPRLALPAGWKKHTARAARWILIVAGGFAIALGLALWPGELAVLNPHRTAGWLTFVALFTLAAFGKRAGVSRTTTRTAVILGIVALVIALAQNAIHLGNHQWIVTVVHAAAGVAALVGGLFVAARMHLQEMADATTGQSIADAATEFLAGKRIALTGVSRTPATHGANIVYRRLRERGYTVYAVNPNATEVEGDRTYRDLKSIPGPIDGVVIGTRPDRAMAAMRECADLGISHVWMHRSVGTGSVSEEAAAWGRQRGIHVIAGGCPLMFDPCSDTGHKIMRPLLTLTGKVPRRV